MWSLKVTARFCGPPPPACPGCGLEMEEAQFLAWICRGVMLVGVGKLDIPRRMEIGILQCTVIELGREGQGEAEILVP